MSCVDQVRPTCSAENAHLKALSDRRTANSRSQVKLLENRNCALILARRAGRESTWAPASCRPDYTQDCRFARYSCSARLYRSSPTCVRVPFHPQDLRKAQIELVDARTVELSGRQEINGRGRRTYPAGVAHEERLRPSSGCDHGVWSGIGGEQFLTGYVLERPATRARRTGESCNTDPSSLTWGLEGLDGVTGNSWRYRRSPRTDAPPMGFCVGRYLEYIRRDLRRNSTDVFGLDGPWRRHPERAPL